VTRDFLNDRGEIASPGVTFDLLHGDDRIAWEYLPDNVDAISADLAARYDAILTLRPRYTAESVGRADRRLALIARFGVGYDRIDVDACTRAGVLITITPEGVRRPVAQAVITFVLALAGNLMQKDRITRRGDWGAAWDYTGIGVQGRTLGLIGAGNIGRDVVKLATPFGMRVLAHDPFVKPEDAAGLGAELVELDRLFRESDFVSVNCPLNAETRGLVNAERLALMKPSAYLINTARGPIVDERALYEALASGRIAGAGLDVFEIEPTLVDNPILKLDNVIVTPHALCWTDQCFRGNSEGACRSILAMAQGEAPANVVNRAALEDPRLKARMASWAAQGRAPAARR
jgi:D-3-phosphoglycerate dehydrogenase